MIESPVLKQLIADSGRGYYQVLVARFGAEARALEAEMKAIDDDRLDELITSAATCPSLDAFREQVSR